MNVSHNLHIFCFKKIFLKAMYCLLDDCIPQTTFIYCLNKDLPKGYVLFAW